MVAYQGGVGQGGPSGPTEAIPIEKFSNIVLSYFILPFPKINLIVFYK
jgi:hypothetical protein